MPKYAKIVNIVVLALTLLANVKQLSIHIYMVPKFKLIFDDMGLPLLDATTFLLNFNSAFILLFSIMFVFLSVKEYLIKSQLICRRLNITYLVLSAIYLLFIIFALFRPLIGMQGTAT